MLVKVLRQKADVLEIRSLWHLVLLFLHSHRLRGSSTRILIYTSLMAPFVMVLKLVKPTVPVFYMIRGDEITYVKQRGRHFRAMIAFLFQKLLVLLRCHFVFVCEDIRVLFEERLGRIKRSSVLPNTLGKSVQAIRAFDGRVGLIGHFDSVKNIEWAIENLQSGNFSVHLFGNYTYPEEWRRPWLQSHGFIKNLPEHLRQSCSLLVLSDVSGGFPNIVLDALEAGCGVVVHRDFPFKHFPISDAWRFSMSRDEEKEPTKRNITSRPTDLEQVLERLLREKRDFKKDNPELIQLLESSWEQRVWDILI